MTRTVEIPFRTLIAVAATAVVAFVAALVVSNTWRADAAPGDTDATYNPTAGCRITDTRGPDNIGPRSTPLGPDETYEITIHGSNGECTGPLAIPTDATGIAANVTAVGATTSSNIRIFPANLTEVPLLSNLNVSAGAPPTPNKVDVQLSPDGKIKAYNFRGNVHLIIDIVGFYTASSLKELAATAGTPGPEGPVGPAGPAGVVTMHHGYGPVSPNNTSGADLAFFSDTTGVSTSSPTGGGRSAHVALHGPTSMAGVDYALDEVRYCIRSFVDFSSRVSQVRVRASSPVSTTTLALDLVGVATPGCYDLAVDDVQARESIVLTFQVSGNSAGDGASFVGISSTWVPLS
ncbi:MAG: hypothetical protein AAFY28_18005 [Actinomycetota bacterium]